MAAKGKRLWAAAASTLTVVAFAQQPTSQAIKEPTAPSINVEVTGHYENGIGSTDAASAGVITPQLIDDRPLLRPGEVLEYVPGMIVTQHSGAGKANQYFLRGFNLDHGTDFATTLLGMPVNMRTHAHGQGWTDLNFVIPELISRIEYFKGPYYADQGDFATAGAARMFYAEKPRSNLVEVTGGSDRYGRVVSIGSVAAGPGNLAYGFEAFHENGPWQNPDNYRRYNGVLRYTTGDAESRLGITAMAYSGQWNATDQIPLRAVDSGALDRFGAIDPSDGGQSHRYSLSLDYDVALGGGRLQTTAYAIRYDLDLYSNFTYFLDHPEQGDQFNQRDERKVYGWNGSWRSQRQAWGRPLTNVVGWDFRQDRIAPVALYDTVDRVRTAVTREDRVTETSYALFAENQVQWSDWLRSVIGIRADAYRFRVASTLPENSGTRDASLASPKLSLIFGPWRKTELFLNGGYGFHSNDARGTTTTVDPKTGDAVQTVTPLVRTKGAEVGVRSEIVPGLQSSLALWQLTFDSELVFVGDAGTTEAGRASRRYGVEWSNRYQPVRALLIDLDLAWTRARFTQSDPAGNYIPGALEATVAGGITLREVGPWTVSVFGRYFGPRPLTEDNRVRSRSTTLFNAQATYGLTRNASLRFDAFNIFDRKADDVTYYYASRLPGEPAGGVEDIHFHPAERRSYRVGLLYRF